MPERTLFFITGPQGTRPTWRLYAMAVLGGAIFVGLVILAASLAVILLPVAVVLLLVLRYVVKRQLRKAGIDPNAQAAKPTGATRGQGAAHRQGSTVIEGDYEIVGEDESRDRRP